jgi:hypothetical protein
VDGDLGGLVKADQELYDSTAVVKNEVFPISYQWDHNVLPDYYKQWKPVVQYSSTAGTFVVVWRKTPKDGTGDLTPVNHIRVNTSSGYRIPPLDDLVVSATGGTENPSMPVLAASSRSGAVLMVWEDHRGFLGIGDIYGTMFDAVARTTSGINPGDPTEIPVSWRSISAGNGHALGIRLDGSLWAWGSNDYGQLGIVGVATTTTPTRVGSYLDWVAVDAGAYFSVGIRADGCLYAWGDNQYGQLGVGDYETRWEPTLIPLSCPSAGGARDLTITPAGAGSGTVTGNGINCSWNGSSTSGTCAVILTENMAVNLSASQRLARRPGAAAPATAPLRLPPHPKWRPILY